MKLQLALLAALATLATTLLVAAARILLLLLTGLLSALLRIALLRFAVRIILVLRILVRIGHCGSLRCGATRQANAPAPRPFLRFFGSIVAEQLSGTRVRNAYGAPAFCARNNAQTCL
jgi:hypothetical protein